MPRARSGHADGLVLIVATTLLILTAQRYFQPPPQRPDSGSAALSLAERNATVSDMARPGHGRLSGSPLQIPWTGWKDILWRTYQQIGEDRASLGYDMFSHDPPLFNPNIQPQVVL